jgi:hypothetical protein
VVAFKRFERRRRGGRAVLGTRINRNVTPPGNDPGVPQAPPTRPGRLCVGEGVASSNQYLTIQFVSDMLAGVHHGDKVTLVGAGGAAPLTFDVTHTEFNRAS